MGWSAGRHVDHPCGVQISPWPAGKVTDNFKLTSKALHYINISFRNLVGLHGMSWAPRRTCVGPVDWRLSWVNQGGGRVGGGVGTAKGSGKSMHARLSKLLFSNLPFVLPRTGQSLGPKVHVYVPFS